MQHFLLPTDYQRHLAYRTVPAYRLAWYVLLAFSCSQLFLVPIWILNRRSWQEARAQTHAIEQTARALETEKGRLGGKYQELLELQQLVGAVSERISITHVLIPVASTMPDELGLVKLEWEDQRLVSSRQNEVPTTPSRQFLLRLKGVAQGEEPEKQVQLWGALLAQALPIKVVETRVFLPRQEILSTTPLAAGLNRFELELTLQLP